jgi:anti-sigma regulatory factor (Ser/Thr protein kinase)
MGQRSSGETATPERTARSFGAQPAELSRIRRFVEARGREVGLPARVMDDLQIAIGEACVNVIRHTTSSRVDILWETESDRVVVSVRDQGVYPASSPQVVAQEEAGIGMALMSALMDEVAVLPGTVANPGTIVRLARRRD